MSEGQDVDRSVFGQVFELLQPVVGCLDKVLQKGREIVAGDARLAAALSREVGSKVMSPVPGCTESVAPRVCIQKWLASSNGSSVDKDFDLGVSEGPGEETPSEGIRI